MLVEECHGLVLPETNLPVNSRRELESRSTRLESKDCCRDLSSASLRLRSQGIAIEGRWTKPPLSPELCIAKGEKDEPFGSMGCE
jgi:hypothetical protein